MYRRVPLIVRYTACGGLFNQHYSHIAALSLALALGGDVLLPAAVKRDSFANYFSQDPKKNQVGRCVCVSGGWVGGGVVGGGHCNAHRKTSSAERIPRLAQLSKPHVTASQQVSWTPEPFDTLWDADTVHTWLRGQAKTTAAARVSRAAGTQLVTSSNMYVHPPSPESTARARAHMLHRRRHPPAQARGWTWPRRPTARHCRTCGCQAALSSIMRSPAWRPSRCAAGASRQACVVALACWRRGA